MKARPKLGEAIIATRKVGEESSHDHCRENKCLLRGPFPQLANLSNKICRRFQQERNRFLGKISQCKPEKANLVILLVVLEDCIASEFGPR